MALENGNRFCFKHLNADTSWLLTIPAQGKHPEFNFLIDPCENLASVAVNANHAGLKGVETEYYNIFSNQEHSIPSCVDHISDLKKDIDAVFISYEVSSFGRFKADAIVLRSLPQGDIRRTTSLNAYLCIEMGSQSN